MGFSMKIMPGVRVRASTRGVGLGVGPRAARIHVSTRSVGVSSGAGPFSVYAGSGPRRRSRTSYSAYERQARQASRYEEIEAVLELNRQVVALASAHTDEFPEATKP